jgi:hypothetical protein
MADVEELERRIEKLEGIVSDLMSGKQEFDNVRCRTLSITSIRYKSWSEENVELVRIGAFNGTGHIYMMDVHGRANLAIEAPTPTAAKPSAFFGYLVSDAQRRALRSMAFENYSPGSFPTCGPPGDGVFLTGQLAEAQDAGDIETVTQILGLMHERGEL